MLLQDKKGNRYQVRGESYGWVVTVHGANGRLRYIGNAGNNRFVALRCLARLRLIFGRSAIKPKEAS